jgi:hypothetical protein
VVPLTTLDLILISLAALLILILIGLRVYFRGYNDGYDAKRDVDG